MLKAANEVSNLCQNLVNIWRPLVQESAQQTLRQKLTTAHKELEVALNNLRAICKPVGEFGIVSYMFNIPTFASGPVNF